MINPAIIMIDGNEIVGSSDYTLVVPPGYNCFHLTEKTMGIGIKNFTIKCNRVGWRWSLFRFVSKHLIGVDYPKGSADGSIALLYDFMNELPDNVSVTQ